jgi:hypothetical protein
MRDSASAAQKAADAARDSITQSEEQARLELRAYVGVESGVGGWDDTAADLDRPQSLQQHVVVKNYGATPAHQVRMIARLVIQPYPLPDTFNFNVPLPVEHSVSTLSPTEPAIVIASTDVTPRQLAALSAEHSESRIYVFGRVTYMDIFGDGRQTNFCFTVRYFGQKTVLASKYWINNDSN